MMIHFMRPYCLLILLPVIFYLVWVIYLYKQYNPWKKVCDAHLLPALLKTTPYSSQRLIRFALFLFFSLGIFALSGPSWKKTSLPVYRSMSSLMLVLDLSSNMQVTDLKPDRLTRAKFKIRDLITLAQNMQMGLVVFTKEAFVVSPLSQDANTLTGLLDELNPKIMPVFGSDSGQGLLEAYKLLKQTFVNQGHILLITASEPTDNSWAAAKRIAKEGGHLNVLAMLDTNPRNQPILIHLQALAKIGNGSYYHFTAMDTSDIQPVVDTIKNQRVIKNNNAVSINRWLDAGPWFCLFLIPIALFILRENMMYENN